MIIGTVMTFSAIPYTPKHGIYNNSWQGASNFRNAIESEFNISTSRILVSPIILSSIDNIKFVIIIGSERSYTEAEINAYLDFMIEGGTILLFEDFGPAKKLFVKLQIQFWSGMVKESNPYISVNRPSQFFIRDTIFSQYIDRPFNFIMVSEAAGVVDPLGMGKRTTIPILMTYPSAFVDRNNDNIIDTNDLSTPSGIPMGLYKPIGEKNGSVVVIGDASLPLNQYWERKIPLNFPDMSEEIILPLDNADYLRFLVFYLTYISGATSILFDESHQAIAINSAAGIFNLIAGTWVGLINTALTTVFIFLITFTFSTIRMRKKIREKFRVGRRNHKIEASNDIQFISHPSSAERSISEQYILYQVMKDSFIQVANSQLVNQIKSLSKADNFLNDLELQYGDLTQPNSLQALLDLHSKLRDYVDNEKSKWL